MVRTNQSKPLDDQFGQFEQIIYRKQVDLKGPQTKFEGSLKTLYKSYESSKYDLSSSTTLSFRNYS